MDNYKKAVAVYVREKVYLYNYLHVSYHNKKRKNEAYKDISDKIDGDQLVNTQFVGEIILLSIGGYLPIKPPFCIIEFHFAFISY